MIPYQVEHCQALKGEPVLTLEPTFADIHRSLDAGQGGISKTWSAVNFTLLGTTPECLVKLGSIVLPFIEGILYRS